MLNGSPQLAGVRNVEAEALLLGAMLIDNRWIDRAADKLRAEDFFDELHGRIFSAILSEAAHGRSVSAVSLKPYLVEDPAIEAVGGIGYLGKLSGHTGALLGAATAIDQIVSLAERRRLIQGLAEAAALAADMNVQAEDVVRAADAAITPLSERETGIVQISAGAAYRQMLEQYDNPHHGVTSGGRIKILDDALGPILPHHLVIKAGRPGMGKTTSGLSYAAGAAEAGHGVLFASLEMNRNELMQRAAADAIFDGDGGIPYEAFRDGHFTTDNARRRAYELARYFDSLPMVIVDASSLTVGRLNMIVRKNKRRMHAAGKKLELVVVDYLQLLHPNQRCASLNEAVSEVSRGLKELAKQNDVGVLALAQLNRGVESREDKRPQLRDLRDSGQIEQDADGIVFLYREEYYLKDAGFPEEDPRHEKWRTCMAACANQIDFIIAKRRNGATAIVKGVFSGIYQAVRG